MLRRTAIVLVALLALTALTATVTADGRTVRLRGVIAEVQDHGIVLHTERGDVTIGVTERTHIMLNGHDVHLADLHRGDRARVLANVQRDRGGVHLTAIIIDAHRSR